MQNHKMSILLGISEVFYILIINTDRQRAMGSDQIVTMDFNPWTKSEKEIEFQRNGTFAPDA
ncbi:MAG TPA: hypothetical protein PKD18_19230 [Saprospiraceae bacterium]|nr:hypothetical protein [Saprospiraceae bacterium]